jgi:hypothetical protein
LLAFYNTSGTNRIEIEYFGSSSAYGFRAVASQDGYTTQSQRWVTSRTSVGWHSVVGAWSGYSSAPSLWVDGASITGSSQNGSGGTLALNRTGSGSLLWSGSRQYKVGKVAFLAVWNATLTDNDALALSRVHPTKVAPLALQACWDLGGFSGENDKDLVGGYNMTAYGSPTWAESPPIIYPRRRKVFLSTTAAAPATTPAWWAANKCGNKLMGCYKA